MLLLLACLAFAEEPEAIETVADAEIEVVASKDIEVFVAPIKINNLSTGQTIEAVIDEDSAFAYTGSYAPRNVKTVNDRGIYEPLSLAGVEMMVYNERTIGYHWPDCNYRRDPLKCTIANSQYFMETIITIDDNQLVVRSTLYDSYAQVVSTSTQTDNKIVRWIKQQETTVVVNQQNGGLLGGGGTTTTIHQPKEELPLKWEIPHMLTDKMIRDTVVGLWTGLRLK
tara:strand:+ start:12300 stop:12977 length:678 start_codon:yes stop_codon:yes gene_type:complete